jgi:phosphate starvation-inducible membrane PsiE
MAWDQIAALTVVLFSARLNGLAVLFIILVLALGKELVDHFFIAGHCYPKCMDEHTTDFVYSLLFFFLYLPPLHFYLKSIEETPISTQWKHYAKIALVYFVVSGINYYWYSHTHPNTPNLLQGTKTCLPA